MPLTTVTTDQATALFEAALAGGLKASETLADLIRTEVTARGHCPRRFLVDRVVRLVEPITTVDPERVAALTDALERAGDLVVADGGQVYPAPLRVVSLDHDTFRFACALPTRRLVAAVPGRWTCRHVRRECQPKDALSEAVAALGGVVVTPEAWAGLAHHRCADADWLRELNARLTRAPEPARSLEPDEPLAWQGFEPGADGPRWQPVEAATLWRARHRQRRWVFAWTGGASPAEQAFLPLYADEATRTGYALARATGLAWRATCAREGDGVLVRMPGWLPMPEYRYMATVAEPMAAPGGEGAWLVPAGRLAAVSALLATRLGIEVADAPQ